MTCTSIACSSLVQTSAAPHRLDDAVFDVQPECDAHVVVDTQRWKKSNVLKGARDAAFGDFERRLCHDIFAAKLYFAFGRLIHAGDQVEHRRFARAIWPDQSH